MSRSFLRAVIGASLLVLVAVGPGMGHAELSSASPGPGDVVSIVPPELVASFTQDMRQDRTKIELLDESGRVIAQGGRHPDRLRVQKMALPPLAPGAYEVRWVTFSDEDDELHRGRYAFTVVEASLPSPSPVPTECSSPAPPTAAPTAGEGAGASSSPSDASVTPLPSPTPCPDEGTATPSASPTLSVSPAPTASTPASPGQSPGPSARP